MVKVEGDMRVGQRPLHTITGSEFDNDLRRRFQVNDLATVEHFLKQEQPRKIQIEEIIPGFLPLSPGDIEQMLPDREWFSPAPENSTVEPGLTHADTIHGVRHAFRVGLYARLLSQTVGLSLHEEAIVKAAALVHDTKREDDTVDIDHGVKAANYWRDKLDKLRTKSINLSDEDKEVVAILCQYHEKRWDEIPAEIQEAHGKLLKIFMAADALDRFRSPSKKWWPNAEYFNHDVSVKALFERYMPFAEYYTLQTEYYRLKHNVLESEAFLIVGQTIGIFENEYPTRNGVDTGHKNEE